MYIYIYILKDDDDDDDDDDDEAYYMEMLCVFSSWSKTMRDSMARWRISEAEEWFWWEVSWEQCENVIKHMRKALWRRFKTVQSIIYKWRIFRHVWLPESAFQYVWPVGFPLVPCVTYCSNHNHSLIKKCNDSPNIMLVSHIMSCALLVHCSNQATNESINLNILTYVYIYIIIIYIYTD